MLLQSSYNYKERGMDTLLFAPQIDTRYGEGKINSRIGLESEALMFANSTNLYEIAQETLTINPNVKCVLIDEAQFLTKQQVLQCCQITDDLNIPVLAYGIRTDFRGEPFEGSLYLLAWSDLLVEIKTICFCGKKAIMNQRIDEYGHVVKVGEQIEIGGNERYISTCRKHFKLGEF